MVSREELSTRLLAFNGDLLSVELVRCVSREEESRAGSELRYRRLSFEKETGCFSAEDEGVIPVNRSRTSEVGLVASTPVVNVKSGQMVPCILLRKQKKKSSCFKYVLVEFNNSGTLKPLLEFKLPYEMKDNITVCQGPTVLWSNENTVYYTSVETCEVRQVPIQLLSVSFIGELPISNRKIIILGCQKSSVDESDHQLTSAWSYKSLGYFLEDGKLFNGAWILPDVYSSVLKCVLFISAEEAQDGVMSSLLAATSRNQLVWFENGIPKRVCQLPFEEPQAMQMASTGPDGDLFFISFRDGNVCGVWRRSFQVACCWQGVSSLCVNDFVGCGTDQGLLLFESHSPPGGALANFTLTDLRDITYSGTQEQELSTDTADRVQENYLLTVQALESRLQGATTSLRDLQRELEVKDGVLQQSVQALLAAVSGRQHGPSVADQDLVPLWDEDAEEEEGEEGSQAEVPTSSVSCAPPLPPPVERLWQRVTEDRWVVGVVLRANAWTHSASVSLLLDREQGPEAHVVCTSSRVFSFPQPCLLKATSQLHPGSAAKRRRQAEEGVVRTVTLTAVADLAPLLAQGSPTCTVLLHGVRDEDAPAAPATVCCGRVSLCVQDTAEEKLRPQLITNCRLATEECLEDLVSLLATRDSASFSLCSPHYTLCDVPQWLLGAVRCDPVAVSPDYLLCTADGFLASMLFRWEQKTRFEGVLHLVYRSQCQLLQFLDALCHFLPPSCEVTPLHGVSMEELSHALASSLKVEVSALRDGVSSLLRVAAERAWAPGPDGDRDKDELLEGRAGMEEERERRRRLGNPTVKLEEYRKLNDSLCQGQLETDTVGGSLCRTLALLLSAHQP